MDYAFREAPSVRRYETMIKEGQEKRIEDDKKGKEIIVSSEARLTL